MQTAVVVGPDGEEIYTDDESGLGRVKIQFQWDRFGENNASSSCWVRVSTPMAGANWGMIHIPRIGQEVVVSFEEGNPNRPLITGMVYNATNTPPFSLPDNKTQSGIMTCSSLDGTPQEEGNILRFEDKQDEEEIYLHAERDLNTVVENNETHKVGFDVSDAGDQTIEIYNHQNVQVGVGSGSGDQITEVQNNRELTVNQGDEIVQIMQGNREVTLDQGNDTLTLSMGSREVNIEMGNETTNIALGKSETEAMQSIELKVGSSSVKVDQMGVTIKGMMVKIEGTIMTEVKGMVTQVKGSAMLKAQGGITMIN